MSSNGMTRTSWAARAVAGVAMLLATGTSADAQSDGTTWIRFPGQNYNTTDRNYDREFQREWESQPPRGFPTLSAQNLNALKAAIKRYEDIVSRGGWREIPDRQLSLNMYDDSVALLRERLIMSGDLSADAGVSNGYDYYVEKAVKRFQASNGLTPTGVADKRTIVALNVSAGVRLRQLRTNYQRLAELAKAGGKKYIVVNIPAAQIEVVENDAVVSRHSGVVGKIDRQTPILKSAIHQLNFNPVWHLPPTVISKDLVPKGAEMQRRGQDVLAKYGIEALGADGKPVNSTKINWSSAAAGGYSFRQQPGPENPLGFVKINFHNSHSVYMHSTPSESLFGRNFRAASSGCVRIAGIEQVVAWLLADQGWTLEKVLAMKKSGERLDVNLKKPVPLLFAYVTAWATEDGVIQFRRDLYQKDGVGPVASAY
jgi:murein L,D-transpeptidase YcbB/YkuD